MLYIIIYLLLSHMNFNKHINNKESSLNKFIGGNMGYSSSFDNNHCLCIFIIIIIIMFIVNTQQSHRPSSVSKYENFNINNKTINPNYKKNYKKKIIPVAIKQKQNIFDGLNSICDEECVIQNQNLRKQQMPDNINKAELEHINKQAEWNYEGFGNASQKAYHMINDGELYDNKCNRADFIETRMSDGKLQRSWKHKQKPCDYMELNQNKWMLNEGFLGDKGINDSKVLPYRSLPEQKIHENFENKNTLTYSISRCSDSKNAIGFDDKSKYYGDRNDDAASYFQHLDENNLSNNVKLLNYLNGDVLHSNLNDDEYNNMNEQNTISNQPCT